MKAIMLAAGVARRLYGEENDNLPKALLEFEVKTLLARHIEILRQLGVDELVMVSDDEIRDTMGMLFRDLKIAVEPACAASTAALCGSLNGRLAGKKVVLLLCGSNIDWKTFETQAHLGKQIR